MSIRPIDQVSMVSKVQKVSGKQQMEKSKEQTINHNTFADIHKKNIKKQEKVNDTDKTVYNKITRENRGGRENKKEEKKGRENKGEKNDKGKNIDIRI